MTDDNLVGPLADDCVLARQVMLDRALPPVWQLDADTARRLHLEGNRATRAAWTPAVDTLPVTMTEESFGGRPSWRYVPDGREPVITLAWLHGGGWVLGGLETADAISRTICDLTGWEVVSIDYRCAPADRFPAAVDDSLAAVSDLLATRARVVVGGDSAGATLSAVVAHAFGSDPRLVGQLLVYPATDPALASPSAHEFVEGPFLTRRDMEWFYDAYLADADRTDPRADLTTVPGPTGVPAVVLTVGHDPLRDDGISYARALEAAGDRVTWIHAPELFHGSFTSAGVLPSAMARAREACAAMQQLLA